jgi:hypothetical protein
MTLFIRVIEEERLLRAVEGLSKISLVSASFFFSLHGGLSGQRTSTFVKAVEKINMKPQMKNNI